MRESEAWRLLDLSPAPTMGEVRAAYRRRAKELHPDVASSSIGNVQAGSDARATGGTAASLAFARLTEAYAVALAEARLAGRKGPPRARPLPSRPARSSSTSMPPRRGARAPYVSSAPGDAATKTPVARPGSTTYDGSAPTDEDPPWDGARWVGADSGTYWTINPREYADPRKHGPEYRARGRRPVRHDGRGATTARGTTSHAPIDPTKADTTTAQVRATQGPLRALLVVAAAAAAILVVRLLLASPSHG
jgi:hypothetical protein